MKVKDTSGALFIQLLLRFGPSPLWPSVVLYRCDVEEYLKDLGYENAPEIAASFVNWQYRRKKNV